MTKFLPRSLFAQTALILVIGLLFSQLVGAWLYGSDRAQALRTFGGMAAAQRVANIVRLMDEAPVELRGRMTDAINDPSLRLSLSPTPPPPEPEPPMAGAIRSVLADLIGTDLETRIAVAQPVDWAAMRGPHGGMMHGRRLGAGGPMHMNDVPAGPMAMGPMAMGLAVSVKLSDGQWLKAAFQIPDGAQGPSPQLLWSLASMALVVFAVSLFAVRRVTRPLGVLAEAAERLGRNVKAPPLPETGCTELRQAAQAFNRMQANLQRLIQNRTVMLAAVSHDLRTPLTLLRLRAEGVEPVEDRSRMLAVVSDMEAMLSATLNFARDEAEAEPKRPTDIAALAESLVNDLADAAMPVAMAACPPLVCEIRPQALRRALGNLIENACKYGKSAEIVLSGDEHDCRITVRDQGPGIPPAEMAKITEPFYRIEGSRSRESGGMGLGLAIALSIVRAHGGELIFANREEGGLAATIRLPKPPRPS